MELSKVSKNYRAYAIVFLTLSVIVTFGPILVYAIIGFVQGTEVTKFTMGACSLVAICLFLVNAIFKQHLRSPMWILVLGIYFALEKIETLLIILAITTILDEFIFTPGYRFCKSKYSINKEIDKRGIV